MATVNNVGIDKVKVLLQTSEGALDLNTQGLTSLKFERYLNDPKNRAANILSELDLTTFDDTGYKILSMMQKSKGNIYIRYGFESNMSPTYKVVPTRYNVVQNNRGIMVGVGGYGTQYVAQQKAEYYKMGSSMKQIIMAMASRNGWYTNNGKNIDIPDTIELPNVVYKPLEQSDFDFIKSTLLPILDSNTVYEKKTGNLIKGTKGFYEVVLQEQGAVVELHVFGKNKGSIKRKVWKYTYGTDTQSYIIDMTNRVNYDWIINGLTIQVPIFPEDLAKTNSMLKQEYTEFFNNYKKDILNIFVQQGMTLPETTELTYKIEFYDAENELYQTKEEIVVKKIKDILNTFNTMELVVVGNPHIMATDLIDLKVKNKNGDNMIQTGVWRVIGIEENIGLSGYTTKLTLVRDELPTVDIVGDTKPTVESQEIINKIYEGMSELGAL